MENKIMNPLINAIQKEENKTVTLNNAKAFKSTLNKVLDLFASWGGMRGQNILPLFTNAFEEEQELTLRCILWGRDIRGGAGERQLFRNCLEYLQHYNTNIPKSFFEKIPEVGRWDDLFHLYKTKYWHYAQEIIATELIKCQKENNNGLCAKWMPRQGEIAHSLRTYMKLSPAQWRKMVVQLTNVVEQQMCAKQWNKINYEHVPSKAAQIYKKAFQRHDTYRYTRYLTNITTGVQKINAGAVYPYEIIRQLLFNIEIAEAQWKAQPNYINNDMKFLPVIDCSGSMLTPIGKTTALDIAISLGIYLSERNTSTFKDSYITFSKKPTLQYATGSLLNRYNTMEDSHWEMNTDLIAVFKLILDTAIKNKIKQEDMPTHILIVSDMQFDYCIQNKTPRKTILDMYKNYNYITPTLVFWNVKDYGNKPATTDSTGTILVSGFSPSIMTSILSGEEITPEKQMLKTLMNDKYKF